MEDIVILEDAERLWVKALNAGVGVEANGGIHYSINQNFAKQIETWDKETIGFSFVVGRTSQALKTIGVPDRQIRFHASKLKKILNDHKEMNIDILKHIPGVLEKPILVMESGSVEGRLVVFGDLNASNGKVVHTILELNPTSKKDNYLDVIMIAGSYGRKNTQALINKSEILYVEPNKNRTHDWLKVNRLQLPLLSTQYGPNNSIFSSE